MVAPNNIAEVAEFVRSHEKVIVGGNWPCSMRRNQNLWLHGLKGITELQAADQVVTVLAGTHITELNRELAEHGLNLPIGGPEFAGFPDELAGMFTSNLPHVYEARWGSWREWILGMTVILADGTVAKSGSRVTKSVAGYDNQKLIVESEFELAIPVEVTLRLAPLAAVKMPEVIELSETKPEHVLRVRPVEFDRALSEEAAVYAVPGTGTLWLSEPVRGQYPNAWTRHLGSRIADSSDRGPYWQRAKNIFDPTGKFSS